MLSSPRRLRPVLLLATAGLALAFVWVLAPAADGIRFLGWRLPELCPAAALGGRCPGCGLSRALLAILHGDPALAWSLNPGAFALLPIVLVPLLRRRKGEQLVGRLREGTALLLVTLAAARFLELL